MEGDGSVYLYKVGYLIADNYRLGLTCTPDVDVMPDVNNFNCDFNEADCMATDPPFNFMGELGVTVEADSVSNGDFPAPANP